MQVLIVDDEVFAVNALVSRIEWSHYGFGTPLTSHSLAQAQAVFFTHDIALILCDIEMPQGSGLELFEWIKTYYPLTECIFVTCHDEYSYLRHAMQLGSCDYILKPVDYSELNETLSTVVTRIAARRNRQRAQDKTNVAMDSIASSNPYVTQIIDYITEHLTEPIAVTYLAEILHLSPQHFMRLFKKEMGCSILQYITAKRIGLAVRYLEDKTLTVAEVAVRSGFDNYSYFTRIFKRFTNETPVEFRKNNAKRS